jgi:hypothetical protein
MTMVNWNNIKECIMFNVFAAKRGVCLLCRGGKDRDVFAVKSPSFAGEVCGQHLFILVQQQAHTDSEPSNEHASDAAKKMMT